MPPESRRLLLALALAGLCAASAQATPPLPVPPPPPSNPAFLKGPAPVLRTTGDARVDAYRADLLARSGDGWTPYLTRFFAGVRADPAIVARYDRMQALRDPAAMIAHYVTPARIARGKALFRQLRIPTGAADTPPEVRLALWGMLTDYGARPPARDAIQSLLVLGAYGRGAAPWDFQIHHAARLVLEGKVSRTALKSDESGRLGQPHLLPDRFDIARDGDRDGRADVWTNRADILASLNAGDWRQNGGQPVYVAVRPERFDRSNPLDARRARSIESPGNFSATLLPRWDGKPWTQAQRNWSGHYLEPYGKRGPAFVLLRPAWLVNTHNPWRPRHFDDSNDMGFALAAGLLADAIAGRPLPALPKPGAAPR